MVQDAPRRGSYACARMSLPDVAFFVFFSILVAMSLPLIVYWLVVFVRIRQTVSGLPTGMDGIALAERSRTPDRPVLVVVPAHNEAGSIAPLIRSLREQDHERFRVVLALDRCTDATAAVARQEIGADHRFEVCEISEVEEGWAGKVNAVRVGIERSGFAAEAEFFLFTDADCLLHPSCLRATVALAEERDLDLLSFLNEYPSEAWYESLVQPAAGFELMRQYPLLRANRTDDRQRPFANGQFMLFRAGFYRDMGGHATVRDELLEDLALAKAVKARGGRAGALLSGGMVRCRMYESWGDFKRGWRRIYTEAAHRRSSRISRAAWRVRLLGVLMPAAVVFSGVGAAVSFLYSALPGSGLLAVCVLVVLSLGALLLASAQILRVARGSLTLAPLVPVGYWLVSEILFKAADQLVDGQPTNWGGRSYVREDRSRIVPIAGGSADPVLRPQPPEGIVHSGPGASQ